MDCAFCDVDKKEKQACLQKESKVSQRNFFWIITSFALLTLGLVLSQVAAPRFLLMALYLSGYAIAGIRTFPKVLKNLKKGRPFDENLLVILATVGALALQEFAEATTVMALYALGEFLEKSALERSSRSIRHLLAGKPEFVHIQKDDRWVDIPPQEVQEGAILRIDPGEKVLLDGVVLEGFSYIDTSSLTGESLPLFRKKGDEVLSGSINREGSFTLKATRNYAHSTINTVTELLENALQRKASMERFITRFSRFYTPLVILLALLFLVFPLTRGTFTSSHLYQALTLLMISCPCALVISIPVGFLAGIGKSAREGVLIKSSSHLESLAYLTRVFFDKTGTLTEGRFRVKAIQPSDGYHPEEILKFAAIAASRSHHPLAQAILATQKDDIILPHFEHYREIPGAGIVAKTPEETILLGNERLLKNQGISPIPLPSETATVHLARNGEYLGFITFEDTTKSDAAKLVRALEKRGIEMYLLSGDKKANVARIAQETGIKTFFAELLPQDKVKILEEFLQKKKPRGKIAFVGDGMNDAPALALADIGIAMGKKGIDMTIEAADIVLMTERLSSLEKAIEIAHRTRRILWQNIGLAIGAKALFLALALAGKTTLWEAVFADVGVLFITILNSLRIMR